MGKQTLGNKTPTVILRKQESAELFHGVKQILAYESGVPIEWIKDQDVCRLMYEGYPYGSLWKSGKKDVGRAVEMEILGRTLGIRYQWIVDVIDRKITGEELVQLYIDHKDNNALTSVAQFENHNYEVEIDIFSTENDPIQHTIFAFKLQNSLQNIMNEKFSKNSSIDH